MKDTDYRRFTGYKDFVDLKKLDFILQSLEEYSRNLRKSTIQILDIGCGKGDVSLPLASFGYNVQGIDVDKNAISYVNGTNPFPNATFSVLDAEKLDLKKERFDVIICSEVLEHSIHPQLLMESIGRLLKEKGIAIVTIPNGYGPWEILFELPWRLVLYIFDRITRRQPTKGTRHVQNFSMRRFRKICSIFGRLHIRRIGHSDFISGFPMLRKSRICRYDSIVADRLPHFLVSGWYFVLTSSDGTVRCM